jgi:hypothetical protein
MHVTPIFPSILTGIGGSPPCVAGSIEQEPAKERVIATTLNHFIRFIVSPVRSLVAWCLFNS